MNEPEKKSPYHKHLPVTDEDAKRGHVMVDVYQLLYLFEVADPCFAHAIKKLLCPGVRSGGKSVERDIADVIWTLQRWQEIRRADVRAYGERRQRDGAYTAEEPKP